MKNCMDSYTLDCKIHLQKQARCKTSRLKDWHFKFGSFGFGLSNSVESVLSRAINPPSTS